MKYNVNENILTKYYLILIEKKTGTVNLVYVRMNLYSIIIHNPIFGGRTLTHEMISDSQSMHAAALSIEPMIYTFCSVHVFVMTAAKGH